METNKKEVNKMINRLKKGEKLSYENTLGTACSYIYDKKTAKRYWDALIKWHTKRTGHTRKKAIKIEASNLGYYKGYYDIETIDRVTKLFRCIHPIFGW